jgi:hypothetical protein
MQGGKNCILPKRTNANRFFWDSHWLEIWKNHIQYVPLWDWMEGTWLWTLYVMKKGGEGASILTKQWTSSRKHCFEFYWYNRTSAESISRVPKNSRFPGPNPLPLAHVMYLPASKTLRTGTYKCAYVVLCTRAYPGEAFMCIPAYYHTCALCIPTYLCVHTNMLARDRPRR